MKSTLKGSLLAISLGLFALSAPAISFADHHGEKQGNMTKMGPPSAEFMQNLNHASFMPNLMRHLVMNKSVLELNGDQLKALKGYNQENSPKVQAMVAELMALESKAYKLALADASAKEVTQAGEAAFEIREDLMKAKLKCRDFVKTVLTANQYEQALKTYQ